MWNQEGLHDRLPKNTGDSVVIHLQLSHNQFPMDGVLVGSG